MADLSVLNSDIFGTGFKPSTPKLPKSRTGTDLSALQDVKFSIGEKFPKAQTDQSAPASSSFLDRASGFLAGAAQSPSYKTGSWGETFKNLPNEIVRTVLPNAAAINDNPELTAQVSNKDIAKEVPKLLFENFVAPLASFALTFYGASNKVLSNAGINTGANKNGEFSFDIPGLGKVTNVQARIAEKYANGGVPSSALGKSATVAGYTGQELLNGLYTASLLSHVVNPRLKSIADINPEQSAQLGQSNTLSNGVPEAAKPKSFQLYQQPTIQTAQFTKLDPAFVKKLTDTGIDMSKYDPANPTYFRFQLEPTGQITGKIVQVKPSYLEQFLGTFKGDITKVPVDNMDVLYSKDLDVAKLENPNVKSSVVPPSGVLIPTASEVPTQPFNPKLLDNVFAEAGNTVSGGTPGGAAVVSTKLPTISGNSSAPASIGESTPPIPASFVTPVTSTSAPATSQSLDSLKTDLEAAQKSNNTLLAVKLENQIKQLEAPAANEIEELKQTLSQHSQAEEHLSNILTELELAKPGKRLPTKEGGIKGISSTFPSYIPEELRQSKIINRVIKEINNIQTINYSRTSGADRRMINSIVGELDRRLNINTSPIRERIMQRFVAPSVNTPVPMPSTLPPIKQSTASGPITLHAELVPGLSKTLEEDIIPKGKGIIQGAKNIFNEIATWFNPVGKAPVEGVDILMKHKGTFEQELFRLERSVKEIKKMWDKQPEKARMDFMAKIENGDPVPPAYKDLADFYRTRLDNAHDAITEFRDINFLENFFPHFWKKPGDLGAFTSKAFAKRPLQGTKSFTKERVFATIEDGIAAGFEPISTNPEELMQIYETNVKKFVMAQKIKEDMIAKGMWKFVRTGASAPEDFARIDDAIARIYFPVETKNGSTAVIQSGEYWAQKDIARLINNFLSKDFIYDTALGRGLMKVKNTMNAFQLGFSAFHLTMETLDTVVSKVGIGLGQLSSGKPISALKTIVTSPIAPYSFFKDGQKFFNGDPQLLSIEKDLFAGGASLRERQYYKNTVLDNFFKNVREGNILGAAFRLPMATIEGSLRPLFSYYIPRLKVGAFRALFAAELERPYNIKRMEDGSLTQEKLARDVWNNIENRLGELNYDNLFWNKTLKSSLMLSFRAVGWNTGTVRELGGGILQDFPKQFLTSEGRAGYKKYGFNFSSKMQYTVALFTVIGALGAVYQYLHTGKKPESLKDLYYPKNGAKDKSGEDYRVEFPSYLKDLYQVTHNPIQTVANKMAPEFSTIIDLIRNKDFFGDYVRNTNDNLPTQAKQVALFLGSQFQPFTFQQYQQLKAGKSDPEQRIEAMFGIIKAPKDVIQSAYQKELYNLYREQVGERGPRTPEQVAIADLKTKARDAIKAGDMSVLQELVKQGIITPKGAMQFARYAKLTTDERMFRSLKKSDKAKLFQLKNP